MMRLLALLIVACLRVSHAAEVQFDSLGSCAKAQDYPTKQCQGTWEALWKQGNNLPEGICHEDRAMVASSLLKDLNTKKLRLLDLGAGCGGIKDHLVAGATYIPSDVTSRDFPVIECDYNSGMYPSSSALDVNLVSALGVLEYMCHPKEFIQQLASYKTDNLLISYTPEQGSKYLQMVKLANYLSESELEGMFNAVGYEVAAKEKLNLSLGDLSGFDIKETSYANVVYLLKRTPTLDTGAKGAAGAATADVTSRLAKKQDQHSLLGQRPAPAKKYV